MKTALAILKENEVLNSLDTPWIIEGKEENVIAAMKAYAEQAIQDVLKRAADNLPLSAADAKKAVRDTEYKDLLK